MSRCSKFRLNLNNNIDNILETYKPLFFHSFHSQRKIHESQSYSCMPQLFAAYLCLTHTLSSLTGSADICCILSISAAYLCMQIFVAYTSMTRVSSFENGRNEKIMSYTNIPISTPNYANGLRANDVFSDRILPQLFNHCISGAKDVGYFLLIKTCYG